MTGLSIIIVNYRSWSCLERCLAGLEPSIDDDFEVIVVDNHSADGQFREFAARHPRVKFHESAINGGFAFGCNLGAAEATGQTLLFLNPDVYTTGETIWALARAKLERPDVAILSAAQIDGRGQPRKAFDLFPHRCSWLRLLRWFQRQRAREPMPDPRRDFSGVVECDWVSGSVLMIGRTTFDALGGWSEQYFMYAEDYDLCYRASLRNLRVACTGDVRMLHVHGGSSRECLQTSITSRIEAIISKHVFDQLHFNGLRRWLNHLSIMFASLPELLILSMVDLLTMRRFVTLQVRSGMLCGLLGHYLNVCRSGNWGSRRLPAAGTGLV